MIFYYKRIYSKDDFDMNNCTNSFFKKIIFM